MSERLVFELQAIDNATAPLRKVNSELERTGAATRKLSGQIDSTTAATRKFAMGALQQAGFQIGDFAVQVANGTNKMQAFGQQAPQILQIFGPIGAVVGAAVAIFAAVAVAMDKASGSAGSLNDSIKTLGTTAKAYAEASDLSLTSMQDLEAQFGRNAGAVRELYEAQLKLATMDMAKAQADVVSGLRGQVAEVGRLSELLALPFQNSKMVQQNIANTTASLKANLNMTAGEAMALQEALDGVSKAMGPDQIFASAAALQQAIMAAADASGRLPPELEEAYRAAIELQQSAIAAGMAIGDAADAGKTLNDTNMSDGLTNALSVAQQLALATRNALFPAGGGRGDPRGFVDDKYWSDKYFPDPEKMLKPKAARAGGGGGKTDPIDRLREQIALQQELLGKTEAERTVIQALGVDWKKYGDETFNGLVDQITKMNQLNKLAEQQRQIASTVKSAFSDAFMSMVDGTKNVGGAFKDMARSIISKLYEVLVVQRIVNGVMGIVGKAFPSLAPALAGAKAMGGPVTGGQAYLVGERGPEIVVPSRNSQVVPNNQIGGGGVMVTQNISFGAGVTRAEIQAMLPKIVESTKAAVFDAQRRSVNGMGY